MKKILLTSALLMSAILFSTVQAQPEPGKCTGCAVTKMKREYIEKNFALREDVRVKFWEIYDKYMQEEIKIHDAAHQNMEKIGIKRVDGKYNFEEMNDEQILAYYDYNFDEKMQATSLNSKFYQEIKNVLKPKEIVQYYSLEKTFKKTMATHADQKANPDKKDPAKVSPAKNAPQAVPADKAIKMK